jgi:5-methylcytosine-specific restriction endonuclease McrA
LNYEKIYNDLVEKAKVRGLDKSQHEGYFEIHHIIPRSLGGSNDKSNLVMFTGREHYIAHMLLWKAFPEEVSLMLAAFLMSNRWKTDENAKVVNSKTYEKLRSDYAVAVSEQVSGENNPFYGKTHTEETRTKLKAWHAANPDFTRNNMLGKKHSEEAIAKMSEYQRNRPPMTEETKRKIGDFQRGKPKNPEAIEKTRLSNIGRKKTPEERKKISDALTGKPWSEAQRAGIMASLKYGEEHHSFGIPKSEEQKKKISISLKAKNQRPWENPTCQNFTDLSKWALADYYFDIWCHFDKPGLKKLKKIYDFIHNDDITLSLLAIMRINFSKGWVPIEDEEWVNFSEGYLNDGTNNYCPG